MTTAARDKHRPLRIAWLLNTLATIQLVWFYLARVPPALNLLSYEQGVERTPFQERMLLMFPLRYAHTSPLFQHTASFLNRAHGWFGPSSGHIYAEGILELVIDLFCVVVTGVLARGLYQAASRTALLTPFVYPLVLVMITVTYAIQANYPLRFLYDLPAMAFFTAGLALLYFHSNRLLFAALFIVATINRETTLLLLPAYLLMQCGPVTCQPGGQARWRWNQLLSRGTLGLSIPLLAWWIAWHLWVVHHFAANVSAAGPRLALNLGTILVPLSWPQLFSVAAYLWPLTFLYRRQIIDPTLRAWTRLPFIWLMFMLAYGLLIETRIFGELIGYFACTSALIAEELFLQQYEHHPEKPRLPSSAEQREA